MKKTTGDIKRERIFEIYSRNLELLKKNDRFNLEGPKVSGYICPLCFKIFDRQGLSREYDDHLTLEDVPPKSLGGNVKLLTCKICNNEQGSSLDKHLKEQLLTKDFLFGIPNVKRKAKFNVDNKWKIGGTIHNTEAGGFKLLAIEANSHEEHYHRIFKKGDIKIENINFTIFGEYKKNRAQIAKLRVAYLWLVSKFGYASLINPNMHVVRKQIQNYKSKEYKVFGLTDIDFPSEFEGINFITKPKELRSFAVAFTLKTKQKERKFIVLLPGPTDPGLSIYKALNKMGKYGKRIDFDLTKLNLSNVLTNEERVYDYFRYWECL
jgi:hypothetical protein